MIKDNPAESLHLVLKKVVESKSPTVNGGWKSALGCSPGDKDFPRKHAEVVNLFAGTQSYLLSLPEKNGDREIFEKYLPSWYNAVVFQKLWDNNQYPARSIISQPELDQLGGLGRLLERTNRAVLDDTSIEKLKDGLAKWQELLGESSISVDIKEQIKTQVDHITWLLGNIETFGTNPVLRETRNLAGFGLQMLSWSPRIKKVAVAVAALTAFLGSVHAGVDHSAGILEGLNEVQAQYEIISQPVLALEEGSNHDEQIVDAEVIDDQQLPEE